MSGIDDLMAESNERWANARRRSQGIEDNGLGKAVKTYYTRYFPAGLFALVAVGAVTGILAFPRTPEVWPTLLSFGFLLGVVVAFVGGLIYNAKKVAPAANLGKIDVLFSLESEEQKQVRRQIAGKAHLDPEHLAVTRAAAVQLRKGLATQLLLQPLMPCVFAAQAMNFALGGDNLVAVLMATAVVGIVIADGFLIRDFRRTGRFLTRTAEQAAPGNASL
ncbi:hypothetical protein [Arthrobacter sp. ISL-69]|uniref:hypothetical protein n=1 Tax=Arthrobacter sp. ISL-69 TaxID=2819113 RepID=UPI001BE550DD|nr:hypothetical protein [Arthrobacter sp. ISL-69]MBT2535039.1 hypothetical protein [Arthrobacter sp. ISL-69]